MVLEGKSFEESIYIYSEELQKLPQSANYFPIFDLILLGMGDDGHTASLFPLTNALKEEKKWVTLNEVPQLNTQRITLTYPVLLNSKEIFVLINYVLLFVHKTHGLHLYSANKMAQHLAVALLNLHPSTMLL